jgi:hypothetical protein
MAFMQKRMPPVPIWTTLAGFVAIIFQMDGKPSSMNTFNEHDPAMIWEGHCRIRAVVEMNTRFWQSRQALGHFKNPVALPAGNHHLRRSLMEGSQFLPSASEGLKPAQGLSCALLQYRGRTRGMLGEM